MTSLEWVAVTREEMKKLHLFPVHHFIMIDRDDGERLEKVIPPDTVIDAEEIKRRVEGIFERIR